MAPLPVVVPLIVAAILAGTSKFVSRQALDFVAIATSAAVTIICALLTLQTTRGVIVYWFGGWMPEPHSHFPVGICFMIDPLGAGLATLVSLLAFLAFVFSWGYFEGVKALYHAIMLVFVAAMCGLCLTGDLFNLFVWFELMTAAAVALCGYKSEESTPLQGALNFAVTNTVGAFLSLIGVALLYAFTGSLNMAEVGRTLAVSAPGGAFLAVAFLFVIAGFLVKSALFPFHFWLADAHAVAPTPVCIMFSGVMVELGLYAIVRIYWVVFSGSQQLPLVNIRTLFLLVGAITALLGGLYCYGQRHLKRLLAFSTISHVGLMLIGLGLITPGALAGAALYLLGHGLVKGSLFIGAGILLHRYKSMDEYEISASKLELIPIGVMMLIGVWGLAGLPPFATYFGETWMDEAVAAQHIEWLSAIMILAEILTAGAVLRFTGRVFFGLGKSESPMAKGAPRIDSDFETKGSHSRVPASMWAPMAAMLIAAVVIFPLRHSVDHYAAQFESPTVYQMAVLQNVAPATLLPARPQPSAPDAGASTWWTRIVVLLGTLALAGFDLLTKHRKQKPLVPFRIIAVPISRIRNFQSGCIGDYLAWFALGIAAYGGILLLR